MSGFGVFAPSAALTALLLYSPKQSRANISMNSSDR